MKIQSGTIKKYYLFIIQVTVATTLLLPLGAPVTQAGNYAPMLSQFIAQHNFSDEATKGLFSYLYNNMPDNLKQQILAKYSEAFTKEKSAITKDRIIQITNALMPPQMNANLKNEINREIQKFIIYQSSVRK
jgi:hypothetical protein